MAMLGLLPSASVIQQAMSRSPAVDAPCAEAKPQRMRLQVPPSIRRLLPSPGPSTRQVAGPVMAR